MGDIQTLLADPEFATLSPAGQRALAGRLDPELGSLSDAAFKSFLDKVSHPVTPGMEKLGGVPPGPVAPELPGRLKQYPGWDRVPGASDNMTRLQMAGQFLAAPVTGLLHAPGEVIDWFKRGGHNAGPSGGFLSDEPISMAYGNAVAATGAAVDRSPIGVGPGRFVEPAPAAARSLLEHTLPSSVRVASRVLFPPAVAEKVPAGVLRRLQLRSPFKPEPHTPAWSGIPAPDVTPPADITPIRGQLPSGRVPGPAPARTPQAKPARVPIWKGVPAAEQSPLPEVEPIVPENSALPSGRVVGPATLPPPPRKSARVPLWKDVPPPEHLTPPPVEPIRGPLPSGRVVGTGEPTPPKITDAQVEAEVAKRRSPAEETPTTTGKPATATLADELKQEYPPGTAHLPPLEKLPLHYAALRSRIGDVNVMNAWAKDLRVAEYLKSKGITPEQFEAMDLDTQNAHILSQRTPAGNKHKAFKPRPEGAPLGQSRWADEGIGQMVETLRGLYSK